MGEIVLGISGASGAPYAIRLAEIFAQRGIQFRIVASDAARLTLAHEADSSPEKIAEQFGGFLEDNTNIAAKSASGSAKIDAVVIIPCSGTTLGKIAAGIGDNLITRSAIVALKERRKLILVPREAPYATVHLENMAKISSWGAVIIPASPGFYTHPKTIYDMVDFIVARVLDQIGIDNEVSTRWSGEEI